MKKEATLQTIKRLTLVTDAWYPQVNGVVTTLANLVTELTKLGIEIDLIQPNDYGSFPLPTYHEIRCVWKTKDFKNRSLKSRILDFKPDAIHIATEGSLGWFARHIAIKHRLPFSSGYHTRYPEYVRARYPIPTSITYGILRYFHQAAEQTLVPGESILQDLKNEGFQNLKLMTRGVDTDIFNPHQRQPLHYKRPILLYVGRIAPEKNIEDFLSLDMPGSLLVIGDGPQRKTLQTKYPKAFFLGVKKGIELARYYASADAFVFPSKTDTFGVVNIEAIACGTPVAAYPVTGPKDIITEGLNGATHACLKTAVTDALALDRNPISKSIPEYSWTHATKQFLAVLTPIDWTDK